MTNTSTPVATTETTVDVSTAVGSYASAKSAKARASALTKKNGVEYVSVEQDGTFYVMVKPVDIPLVGEPKNSPKNWAELEAAKISSIEGYDEDKVTLVALPKQFAIKYDGKTVCRLAHLPWAEKVLGILGLATS